MRAICRPLDDRDGDAALAQLVEVAVEDVVVEEHLRGEEVEAGADLFLQEGDVVLEMRTCRMALRVARAAEAEAPDLRDGAHEIDGRVVARRHVTAKSQYVLHASGAEVIRLLKYLLARGHDAGEVGERRRAALVLDERGERDGVDVRAAARSVRDGNEGWPRAREPRDRRLDRLERHVLL